MSLYHKGEWHDDGHETTFTHQNPKPHASNQLMLIVFLAGGVCVGLVALASLIASVFS